MPAKKSHHPVRRQTHVLPTTTTIPTPTPTPTVAASAAATAAATTTSNTTNTTTFPSLDMSKSLGFEVHACNREPLWSTCPSRNSRFPHPRILEPPKPEVQP